MTHRKLTILSSVEQTFEKKRIKNSTFEKIWMHFICSSVLICLYKHTWLLYLLPSLYVYFSKRFYFPLGRETSCCIQSHFLTRGYLLIQFYRRYMHRLLKEVSKVHSKCYCIFQSNSKRHADTKVCGIGFFLKKKSYFHSKAPWIFFKNRVKI